jgi:glycosyltransferase involved in cell wall biosynthesis
LEQFPFFSIILPTYKRPKYLSRALESIKNQVYLNFEVIVVNDGSASEEYDNVISSFANLNLKYFVKHNEGLAAARNYGIQKAVGEFLCFLDDDDFYEINHLKVLFKGINDNEKKLALYTTLCFTIDQHSEILRQSFEKTKGVLYWPESIDSIFKHLVVANAVCLPSRILESYHFNALVPIAEDYEMWTKILTEYPLVILNEFTCYYDQSQLTMSSFSLVNSIKYVQTFDVIFKNIEQSGKTLNPSFKTKIYEKYLYWIFEALKKGDKTYSFKNLQQLAKGRAGFKLQAKIFLMRLLKWNLK